MKKFIITVAAVSSFGIAAPAVAQNWGYSGTHARTQQLQNRIQAGLQRGLISRREAVQLRAQLRQLSQLERAGIDQLQLDALGKPTDQWCAISKEHGMNVEGQLIHYASVDQRRRDFAASP